MWGVNDGKLNCFTIFNRINIIETFKSTEFNSFYSKYGAELIEDLKMRVFPFAETLRNTIVLLDKEMPHKQFDPDYFFHQDVDREYFDFDCRDIYEADAFNGWFDMEYEEFYTGFWWFDKTLELLQYGIDWQGFTGFMRDFYWVDDRERKKVKNLLERLTKSQIMTAYTATFNITLEFTKLDDEFQSILGMIGEMERMVSSLKIRGGIATPDAVWLF